MTTFNAANTQAKVTPPTILVSGKKLLLDGNARNITTSQVVSDPVTTKIAVTDTTVTADSYGTHVNNANVQQFIGAVTVEMTSVYSLKSYGTLPVKDYVYLGKLESNVLNDPTTNSNLAEIRYSTNGKDPSRTHYHVYNGSFIVKANVSGGDNCVIKARTYYRNQWSDVVTFEMRVIPTDADVITKTRFYGTTDNKGTAPITEG